MDIARADGQDWQNVGSCPSCGEEDVQHLGRLRPGRYVFGKSRIARAGIPLYACRCGLIFKGVVPTMRYLAEVVAGEQSEMWSAPFAYGDEVALLRRLCGTNFDLLDIGAAVGGLLTAATGEGRRSALDIVRFDALETRGEFIQGFLDEPAPSWSGAAYDVIAAFDIFEHLYDPPRAMTNLGSLLKRGGHVIIETGDTDLATPRRLTDWYYLNLFEHHLAWNEASIRRLAAVHGFSVVSFEQKAHKLSVGCRPSAFERLRFGFYRASPWAYRRLQRLLGAAGSTPYLPGQVDHMRIVLRRD